MYKRQLQGSKNRITEREYWAQKKGQAKLDKENATLAAEGQPAKQTKFETDKAKLRQTIRNAMSEATTSVSYTHLKECLLRILSFISARAIRYLR